MFWDIFCRVIDNHGDIGVCWRLSRQLVSRGQRVRLWVDDASALRWMAPQGDANVDVLPWSSQSGARWAGDVVIEAFGCELDAPFQALMASKAGPGGRQPVWINLEYLTAETLAERNHRLPSPVFTGPAQGLTKHFFYPGFTKRTGGLLREDDLNLRQASFNGRDWLGGLGIGTQDGATLISLFCYEPVLLPALLGRLAAGPGPTRLLVTAGRTAAAVRIALEAQASNQPSWNDAKLLKIQWLPLLSQLDFDHLLWVCDVNFVRGEDSLVRAIWAGKPLVWQIYPQDDGAHHVKLRAFLDWMQAPASLREFHEGWNGARGQLPAPNGARGQLPALAWQGWLPCVVSSRNSLLAQPDLLSQLMAFANRLAGAAP